MVRSCILLLFSFAMRAEAASCIPAGLDCNGFDDVASCMVAVGGASSGIATGASAMVDKAAVGIDAGVTGVASAFLSGFGLACSVIDLDSADSGGLAQSTLHSAVAGQVERSWTQLHNILRRAETTGAITSDDAHSAWMYIAGMTQSTRILQDQVQHAVQSYSQAVRASQVATGAGSVGAIGCTIAGIVTHGLGFLFCGVASGVVAGAGGVEWQHSAAERRRAAVILAAVRSLIVDTSQFQSDIICDPNADTCTLKSGADIRTDAAQLQSVFNATNGQLPDAMDLAETSVVDSRTLDAAQQAAILSIAFASVAMSLFGAIRRQYATGEIAVEADDYISVEG